MKAPVIDFPCDYPIKIIGTLGPGMRDEVVEVIRRFAPEVTDENVSLHLSRTGKYVSIRVTIRATGEQQLQELFAELKRDSRITMVL